MVGLHRAAVAVRQYLQHSSVSLLALPWSCAQGAREGDRYRDGDGDSDRVTA